MNAHSLCNAGCKDIAVSFSLLLVVNVDASSNTDEEEDDAADGESGDDSSLDRSGRIAVWVRCAIGVQLAPSILVRKTAVQRQSFHGNRQSRLRSNAERSVRLVDPIHKFFLCQFLVRATLKQIQISVLEERGQFSSCIAILIEAGQRDRHEINSIRVAVILGKRRIIPDRIRYCGVVRCVQQSIVGTGIGTFVGLVRQRHDSAVQLKRGCGIDVKSSRKPKEGFAWRWRQNYVPMTDAARSVDGDVVEDLVRRECEIHRSKIRNLKFHGVHRLSVAIVRAHVAFVVSLERFPKLMLCLDIIIGIGIVPFVCLRKTWLPPWIAAPGCSRNKSTTAGNGSCEHMEEQGTAIDPHR
mmetsp:Transcript_21315/g.60848  ORF Transcript_21315/g.60848 Transcript_21315/m.60848 type:complete len:354 (+) Transcript_21315:330-1391(+)